MLRVCRNCAKLTGYRTCPYCNAKNTRKLNGNAAAVVGSVREPEPQKTLVDKIAALLAAAR